MTLEAWHKDPAVLKPGLDGSLHIQALVSTSGDTSAGEDQFFLVYSQVKPYTPKGQNGQNFQSSFERVLSPWLVWVL